MGRTEDPLAGTWPVVGMPDVVEDYLTLTPDPRIEITRPRHDFYEGRFSFGAQSGYLYGVLRHDLGDEACFLFSFEGEDEGDPIHGAAAIKLSGDGSMAGDWVYFHGDVFRVECRR